jgi:hypothetical protein
MMRSTSRVIGVLVVTCGVWDGCLQAQTPETKKKVSSSTVIVQPLEVELLALQVSKLPRNDIGQGIRPGTNETVAFWLANSGIAVDLSLKLDRQIARFDEKASRLIRFADNKDNDLTRPPDRRPVNTFFPENKPITVKLGPNSDEAEVILRGYRTPAAGGTKVQIQADLVFLAGSGEQTAELKDLEPKPETEATIGPLHLTFEDPTQAGAPPRPLFLPAGRDAGSMQIMVRYGRLEKSIKSVACLDPDGEEVATMKGGNLAGKQGGTMMFSVPKMARIGLRVVYFEKSELITVPLRLETGVGF